MRGLSLTIKMLALTAAVGLLAWTVLEKVQTDALRNILNSSLKQRLDEISGHDRNHFDQFVRAHGNAVKVFASQPGLIDYLKGKQSTWEGDVGVKSHSLPPPWFPRASIARSLAPIRYAVLLDAAGRARESYQGGPGLPEELMGQSNLLRLLSHSQVFMTTLGGLPFVIASESVSGPDGSALGSLMLVSPIDGDFLADSQEPAGGSHIVALISADGQRIIASSDPGAMPPGTDIPSLEGRYLATGKSFFDYGSSDLQLQFASFVSTGEVGSLTREIVAADRRQRALAAAVMLGSFALILAWITRNIDGLSRTMARFSRDTLGADAPALQRGDQLEALKETFSRITQEVVNSRVALEREAEEKLLLGRKAFEAERKVAELSLLGTVTEALGVGVIACSHEGYHPANSVMERFCRCCGGIDRFIIEGDVGSAERRLVDVDGNEMHFSIHRPDVGEGQGFILVHDITERMRAEDSARKLSRAVEQSPSMVLITDTNGIIEYVNPKFTQVTGYSQEELIGRNVNILKYGDLTPRETYTDLWNALSEGREWHGVMCNRKKNGEPYWERNSISAIKGSTGEIVHLVAVKEDITERKRMEDQLRIKDMAIETSISAIALADLDAKITYVNGSFLRLWGYDGEGEAIGRPMTDFFAEEGGPLEAITSLGKLGSWVGEMKAIKKSGEYFHVQVSASTVKDEASRPLCMMASFVDITGRKAMEARLRGMSITDELTGLLNRRGFLAVAEKQLQMARRSGASLYLLFADMDNMKWINDNLGHEAGDSALVEIAGVLKKAFREADVIARVGGDEFAVLAVDVDSGHHHEDERRRILGRFEGAIAEANSAHGREYEISISAGIVRFDPQQTESISELISRADDEMYGIKRKKKGAAPGKTV